jgi:hypothetical protein
MIQFLLQLRDWFRSNSDNHTALLCELYQVLGALDADSKVLDQVQAAINNEPLPHTTLLLYVVDPLPDKHVLSRMKKGKMDLMHNEPFAFDSSQFNSGQSPDR